MNMADGGIVMDDSQNTTEIDWTNKMTASTSSEMTSSLTDHLQRLFSLNHVTQSSADDESTAGGYDPKDVSKALLARDEMWREHERSQLDFMEREHERMLQGLHEEVRRLQKKCADLTMHLAESLTTIDILSRSDNRNFEESKLVFELERSLQCTRIEITRLRELNERKEEKIRQLESKCEEQESNYTEELERKKKLIEQLNVDLNRKTAVAAQLTTQLHQLRLKEAVEKQRYEHRRQLSEQQWKRRQALTNSSRAEQTSTRPPPTNDTRSRTAVTRGLDLTPSSISDRHIPSGKSSKGMAPSATSIPLNPTRRARSLALPSITSSSSLSCAQSTRKQERKSGDEKEVTRSVQSSYSADKSPVN